MRHSRSVALGSIGVAALTLGILLSGCGASRTTTVGRIATVAATDTPLPTETTSPAAVELAGCPPVPDTPTQPQSVAVGALNVSVPERVFDWPSELMPNNEPNAPYQIAASAVNNYAPNPPINPSLLTGYELQVCNRTSASHTVTSLSVIIARFTPSSGPVTVWHICDGPYDAATKRTTGGCGGALGPSDFLAATLPSDSAGASAPTTANARSQRNGPNPPIAIDPNESIVFVVAVNGLTSQGTYALSFGISIDGAAPTTLTPSDGSFLMAPSAIVWTGTACQTPAMQAQIPAATQDTYYVCPPAA